MEINSLPCYNGVSYYEQEVDRLVQSFQRTFCMGRKREKKSNNKNAHLTISL